MADARGVAHPLRRVAHVCCLATVHPRVVRHLDGRRADVQVCRLLQLADEVATCSYRDRPVGGCGSVDQVRLVGDSGPTGHNGRDHVDPGVSVPGIVFASVAGVVSGGVPVRRLAGVRYWQYDQLRRSSHARSGNGASCENLRNSGAVRDSAGLLPARSVGWLAGGRRCVHRRDDGGDGASCRPKGWYACAVLRPRCGLCGFATLYGPGYPAVPRGAAGNYLHRPTMHGCSDALGAVVGTLGRAEKAGLRKGALRS